VEEVEEGKADEGQEGVEGEGGSSSSKGPKLVSQFMDGHLHCLVRVFDNGTRVMASMQPGEGGFAQAWFGSEGPIDTEVPNLVLLSSKKVLKKPAASKPPPPKASPAKKAKVGPTPVQEEKTSPEDGEDWEEGTQVYDSEVEVDLEKEVAAPPGKATKAADKPSSQPAKPAMPAVVPHPIGQTYSKPYRYSATGAWAIRRRYGDKKQILQLRGNEEKAQQVLHKALERLHQGMAEEKVIMWAKKQNI